MKKTSMIGIAAVMLLGLVVAGAFAFPFGSFGGKGVQGNVEMKSAIESGNYDAYLAAEANANGEYEGVTLTEEQFNTLAQNHKQMIADRETSQTLQTSIQDALTAKDYNAWHTAVSQLPNYESISQFDTEEYFKAFTALYDAKQNKDWKSATGLAQISGMGGGMRGFGKGMNRGMGMQNCPMMQASAE